MENNRLSKIQKILIITSIVLLSVVLFVPLWQIDLWAPQYPEGLVLLMHPHGLGGDVEIVNGLNHYIGMRELHTDDFIEFTLLPYLISFFIMFCIAVLVINRKKALAILFWAFAIFGVIAMFDFYRWEYNYGHNLDPAAAIKIPGMSYTPPLIGYKQLLNFDVLSRPHIGGVLFFGTGAVLLVAFLMPWIQKMWMKKRSVVASKKVPAMAAMLTLIFMVGCSSGPQPLKPGRDTCDYCKMGIASETFGAEIITNKGKIYKFDDTHCLAGFRNEKINTDDIRDVYLVNFQKPHNLIKAEEAFLVKGDELRSPMGGNVAAFETLEAAQATAAKLNAELISLNDLYHP